MSDTPNRPGDEPAATPDQPSRPADATAAGTIPFEAAAGNGDGPVGVAKLQQDLAEMKDRWVRTEAELDNARRRFRRELDEERRYGALPLAKDLLAVLDNLGRAVEAARPAVGAAGGGGGEASVRDLIVGVEMVLAQAKGILARHSIEPIPSVGQPFDAHLHEALAQERSAQPRGTIVREAVTGYRLHDRVVRPASVFVSSGEA